jgi:hypothetical protein
MWYNTYIATGAYMKMVTCEDDNKPFSYQEWAGPHIIKLTYKRTAIFGPKLQYTRLTEIQLYKIRDFEHKNWEMINGFAIYGKEFSDPKDNKSGTHLPETNVIIMAVPNSPGAIAVLPDGRVLALTTRSWKPTVEHFKP